MLADTNQRSFEQNNSISDISIKVEDTNCETVYKKCIFLKDKDGF